MDSIVIILASLFALLLGAVVGYWLRSNKVKAEFKETEIKVDQIIKKAKEKSSDIKYQAKKDGKQIIQDEREILEKEYRAKIQSLSDQEKNLTKKEMVLEQRIETRDRQLEEIKSKEEELIAKRVKAEAEINKYKQIQIDLAGKLEVVAGMSKDDAKAELMTAMTEEAKVDAAKMITRIEEEAKEDSEKRSKKILGTAMQRFAGEFVSERTIASVELPGDEIKGRLIGREGRNIRAFEQICGVDLVIDDTPGVVVISSFNVVRKEIARITIERLIADGRIHPAKIEEFYEKSKVELDYRLREIGEKAQMEIGIHGLHPEILKLIGALNYRTSYTQNQLQHSIETAFLAGNMAAELGMNVKQARRAGLLHDIGKVLDASAEGSHAMIGADFLKKYGESADILHAIRAHHDDEKPETVLANIVAASDALSGARPGARKALMESYISRLTDIEKIVNSFDGVATSYAISAGREVRVLVENDKVDDDMTAVLSRDIAKKLEEEMSYPGTIKVTVLRETRAVGVAR